MEHNGVQVIAEPLQLIINGEIQDSFFIDPPYLKGMDGGTRNRSERLVFNDIESFYEKLLVLISGNYENNTRGFKMCWVNGVYFNPNHIASAKVTEMQEAYQRRQDNKTTDFGISRKDGGNY